MQRYVAAVWPVLAVILGACSTGKDAEGNTMCSIYTPLTDDVVSPTVLDGCYLVENGIAISSDLVIAAGSTIEFAQNASLTIKSTGSLDAAGTATDPVLLTGEQKTPGYWRGIFFYDTDAVANALAFTTIEYAGGDQYDPADVVVQSGARVSITDSTLRHSAGYGLQIDPDTSVITFARNELTANAAGAALVDPDAVGYLDAGSTYTGNDQDIVEVAGWGDVTRAQTWPGIDAPYLVSESFHVGALLTLAPGAVLRMAQDTDIYVDGNAGGALHAAGTADLPILFTGAQATRGYWRFIRFWQTNSLDNVLDHVTVEYGGGDAYDKANVLVDTGSRAAITHSALRQSAGYGLIAVPGVDLTGFAGNSLTLNQAGAALMDPDTVHYLDGGSTYTGNDLDVVEIDGWNKVENAQTWATLDADYLVSSYIDVTAPLTIEPGANLVFAAGTYLKVSGQAGGSLHAVGTDVAPITFTGIEPTPGYWVGLTFWQASSVANEIGYAVVAQGGGNPYESADIYVDGTSTVSVHDSVIQSSAGYGVWVSRDASVTLASNVFTGNGDVDVYYQP